MLRKYSKLNVVHPKAKWLICFVLTGFIGMVFGLANLSISEAGEIVLNTTSTICFAIYGSSCVLFLYVRLAPRYKKCRAGKKNIERLQRFIANYPDIAAQLDAEKLCREDLSFFELKKLAKQANKLLILLSADDLVESVKRVLPQRNKK